MSRTTILNINRFSLALAPLLACAITAANAQSAVSEDSQLAAVKQYCGDCHNADDYSGGLDLEGILDQPITAHAPEW